jgi:hypothetical protein
MLAGMGRCDRCGRPLDKPGTTYVVRIEVFAAGGPLEVDEEVLAADLGGELERLRAVLDDLDPAEAQDGVYREFRFLLCRSCQLAYVRQPLGTLH